MRIGIITDSVDVMGGSLGRYTKNLVENLLKVVKDEEIILIHSQESDDPIYTKAEEIILPFSRQRRSFLLKVLSFVIYEIFSTNWLQVETPKVGIDVTHIPDLAAAGAPPLGFYKKKSKLVVTLHGVAPLLFPSKLSYENKGSLLDVLLPYIQALKWRYLFRDKVDLIIAVSKSEKRNISGKLSIPMEKIKVIYHGVSSNFKPLDNKEEIKRRLNRNYGIDFPFVLHLSSNQLKKKNIENILKAFAVCKRKYKIKEKLVIGGKHSKSLKILIRNLELENDVILTGYIDEQDLPLFYNAAKAFIFPSLHEGFGMPILEAMACGCPVITSNIYSMPEVAGKAALLVNPYDVEEIAKAICEVVSNKKLQRKLAKQGMKRVKKFTWEKSAKEHLEAYKEVITDLTKNSPRGYP